MNRRDILKTTGALAAMALASPVLSAASTAKKTKHFDINRSALIFIEFQNEWLDSKSVLNGLMQDRPLLDEAIRNAGRVIQKARERGARVVHAGLSLADDPDYMVFGQGTKKSGLKLITALNASYKSLVVKFSANSLDSS